MHNLLRVASLAMMLCFVFFIEAKSQFATPTINGTITGGEYGTHTNGQNQETNGSVWYMTWDNTNLYVAITSANTGEGAVLYLDKDPQTPINGGTDANGTNVGFNYDGTSFAALQFRADIVAYVKNTYREYRTANGSNGWSSQTSGFGSFAESGGNIREFSIPWSAIGGRPTSFAWFGYVTSSGGFVYGELPSENSGGSIGTSARYVRYYIVNSTEDGTSVKPFSRNSYVFNSTSDDGAFGAATVYDFTMNSSGRTITRSSGAWTISGNFRVDAGTVSFGSTTDDATVSGNLVMGSGATLTLSTGAGSDLNVTGNVTLANTNITLNATVVTLGGSVSGAAAGNAFLTNSTGTVARSISGGGSFQFPIASTASSYNPVTIALAGGDDPETFNVRVQSSVNPAAPDNTLALQRTWNIDEANTGNTTNATLTLQWISTEHGSGFSALTGQGVFRHNGSVYQQVAVIGTVSGAGTAGDPYVASTTSAITQFSPFVLGTAGGLPVQLASFTARAINNNVRLDWRTISEVNNYGFYIERGAVGGEQFIELPNSFIAGHGTTNVPRDYTFTDNSAAGASWQYRLKQVDLDGSIHYSEPIIVSSPTSVRETAPAEFALKQNYPNPFNPSTEIKFTVDKTERATLEVYNVLGQKVATLFDGVAESGQYYNVQFAAENLSSGMYLYKLASGTKTQIKRMVLMK